jgi:hypothetical protein
MTQRVATCMCGQLKAGCTGEPVRVSMCHCLECQKRTGSAFGLQARFPQANVEVSGTSSTFKRTGDEGSVVTHHFCPTCGSTVFYENDRVPGHFGVPVGGFADPAFPPPTTTAVTLG